MEFSSRYLMVSSYLSRADLGCVRERALACVTTRAATFVAILDSEVEDALVMPREGSGGNGG